MDRNKVAEANKIIDEIDSLNSRVSQLERYMVEKAQWTQHDDKGGFRLQVTGKGVSAINISYTNIDKVIDVEIASIKGSIEKLEDKLAKL